MNTHPPLDDSSLFQISQILGNSVVLTGSRLISLLAKSNLPTGPEKETKWKRLYNAFSEFQQQEQVSNNILRFICYALAPALFTEHVDKYQDLLSKTNQVLAFSGYEFRESDCKIHKVKIADNMNDAISRAKHLKAQLELRKVHEDIIRFAENEIISENYFHTVLEAIKGVTVKIRKATGIYADGSKLVELVFSKDSPVLVINNFKTTSEKGEQAGFANLLRGIYGTFRNPLAHEAKISWPMSEADALDILCTLSYIHRKLDNARRY